MCSRIQSINRMIVREYPEIGFVTYIIKPQNKRIVIKVTKTGSVTVIIPKAKMVDMTNNLF